MEDQCIRCGISLLESEKGSGICGRCIAEGKKAELAKTEQTERSRLAGIILTTETTPDFVVKERLGIITAECVFGANLFRDFFASVRDIVGGRSKAMQKVFRDARSVVLDELRQEAFDLGADAVISTRLEYNQLSGKGDQLLFVAAVGTAVIISRQSPRP